MPSSISSRTKTSAILAQSCLWSGMVMLAVNGAHAEPVPSSADSSKTFRNFEAPVAPAPATAPPIIREDNAGRPISPEARRQIFTLNGLQIKGMTVYKKNDFTSLYAGKLGKSASVADVELIAADIQKRYRADGYILAQVFVPTQSVGKEGVMTIQVQEGQVANVMFEGDKPDNLLYKLPQDYAEKIKRDTPLRASTLERYLLLINDIPGYQAQAVLRATPGQPGFSDLVIVLNQKKIDALLSTDNRGSRYLGPWENQAEVTFNNTLGLDERTTVRAITTSPTNEMRFIDVIQEYKISTEGTILRLEGLYDHTQPGQPVNSALGTRGVADLFSATVTQPVIRSRLQNLNTSLTFDMHNTLTDVFDNTKLNDDRVRSFRAGGEYDYADNLKGVNIVNAVLSHGIEGLGSTQEDGYYRTRPQGGAQDYTKINLDANRTQSLPYNFSFYTAITGQYSADPLLSSEQFLLGGPLYGTAYDPGELSGDDGLAGKIELRYGGTPDYKYFNAYQLYSYYDVGTVWTRDALATERDRQSLASAGFGVRAYFTPNLSGNLEAAFPLTKELSDYGDNRGRIFAGLTLRY